MGYSHLTDEELLRELDTGENSPIVQELLNRLDAAVDHNYLLDKKVAILYRDLVQLLTKLEASGFRDCGTESRIIEMIDAAAEISDEIDTRLPTTTRHTEYA